MQQRGLQIRDSQLAAVLKPVTEVQLEATGGPFESLLLSKRWQSLQCAQQSIITESSSKEKHSCLPCNVRKPGTVLHHSSAFTRDQALRRSRDYAFSRAASASRNVVSTAASCPSVSSTFSL